MKHTWSPRHLRKVVCSWGTNGLRPGPALAISKPMVCSKAALISQDKRSPIILIMGPANTFGPPVNSFSCCRTGLDRRHTQCNTNSRLKTQASIAVVYRSDTAAENKLGHRQ